MSVRGGGGVVVDGVAQASSQPARSGRLGKKRLAVLTLGFFLPSPPLASFSLTSPTNPQRTNHCRLLPALGFPRRGR